MHHVFFAKEAEMSLIQQSVTLVLKVSEEKQLEGKSIIPCIRQAHNQCAAWFQQKRKPSKGAPGVDQMLQDIGTERDIKALCSISSGKVSMSPW